MIDLGALLREIDGKNRHHFVESTTAEHGEEANEQSRQTP
jgi:hypothetical protein